MNLKFEGYTELSTKGHETYFAGANTADGFKGCYDDIADENVLERLYIIKGGSGSGKSTLMKKIAGDAEDRGIHVVYYSCGSDPYSIDCIIVDGRIGVLDGTFPHVRDMKYPGATSELIDVSCFWDSTVLENACKEVVEHSVKKKECYASCYRMLSAAREINREKSAVSKEVFLHEKAAAFVDRFVAKLGRSNKKHGDIIRQYTHALTMKGAFSFPTLKEGADTHFIIKDYLGTAELLFGIIAKKLIDTGYDIVTGIVPTGEISGILIPSKRVSVTLGTAVEGDSIINMERFVSRHVSSAGGRGRYRLAARLTDACITDSLEYLSRAATEHFAIEEIYKTAMDFFALEEFGKSVRSDILKRLI